MRLFVFLSVLLTVLLPGFGQTTASAGPGLPKDPREVFAAAAPFYDFTAATLKPWHLKATYQLYDDKGKPTEQGTYEYWWASPKVYRSTWTRAGASRTDWFTADAAYRKESGSPLLYFERTLHAIMLFSLPGSGVLDSGRMLLALKMVPAGSRQLACVSATRQWEQDGKLQAPRSAMPDYYCFDPSTLALQMTYSNSVTKEFSQIVKMQGRYIPRQIVISVGKLKIFSVSVDTIEGLNPTDAALIPPADAVLEHETANQQTVGQNGDVTKGELVRKTQPVYPLMAKMAHQQGTVVLAAVIGTDGRIHDLEVLASPSPLLADSAVDAVKRWEYKPYLLNGTTVEVETIVNVTYALGQ
ncbi:MAG: energy transducer TonB [Terracidiphilus sp.]